MTDRELMQQALDALEYAADETKPQGLHGCECLICKTITALSERLAQPEQELVTGNILKDAYNAMVEKKTRSQKLREAGPVAYLCENAVGHKYFRWKKPSSTYKPIALYTTPTLRPWVGLTDEERTNLWREFTGWGDPSFDDNNLMKAIEAKLKEKNT